MPLRRYVHVVLILHILGLRWCMGLQANDHFPSFFVCKAKILVSRTLSTRHFFCLRFSLSCFRLNSSICNKTGTHVFWDNGVSPGAHPLTKKPEDSGYELFLVSLVPPDPSPVPSSLEFSREKYSCCRSITNRDESRFIRPITQEKANEEIDKI